MNDLYTTQRLMQESFGLETWIVLKSTITSLEILFRTMQEGYRGCENMSNQSSQNLTCLVHQMVL